MTDIRTRYKKEKKLDGLWTQNGNDGKDSFEQGVNRYLRNTTHHNNAIISHDVHALYPRIGNDTWTESIEKDGNRKLPNK